MELLGAHAAAVDQYVDINLYSPELQSFPASPAEAIAAGFSSSILALWAMQDTDSTLTDASGSSFTLTAVGSASMTGQRSVGLFDGSSFRAQKAIEFKQGIGGSNYFEAANGNVLDSTWTTAFSVLLVFRFQELPGATACLYNKGTFPGAGFGVYNDGTGTGSLSCQVRDGTNTTLAVVTGNHADGAWHWLYVRYDPVSDTLKADSDITTGISQSTAAIGSTSTTGVKFRIGEWGGAGSAFSGQMRGMIVFGDVTTTVAAIQAWWKHANGPVGITYTRASSFSARIADDGTEGDQVALFKSGQFPYEYSSLITTNPLKIGLPVDLGATNLIPYTDMNIGAQWAGSSGNFNTDSPRGFREAVIHTKAAAGDKMLAAATNGAAVTSGTSYTASVWCKWDGTVTAPELRVYRADGTTLIGTASATDTSNKWRRLSLTFTAPATESVRLSVSGAAAASSTGSGRFCMPMINVGAYAQNWIYTKTATASTATATVYTQLTGMVSDFGTMRAWFVARTQTSASNRIIMQAAKGTGDNTNERVIYILNTTNNVAFYDSSDNLSGGAPADWATAESMVTATWDTLSRFGFRKKIDRLPGSNAANNNTALGANTANPFIYIGNRSSGGEQLGGIVSKIRIWRTPEAA